VKPWREGPGLFSPEQKIKVPLGLTSSTRAARGGWNNQPVRISGRSPSQLRISRLHQLLMSWLFMVMPLKEKKAKGSKVTHRAHLISRTASATGKLNSARPNRYPAMYELITPKALDDVKRQSRKENRGRTPHSRFTFSLKESHSWRKLNLSSFPPRWR
jgi:hypothetical protein